MTEADPDGLRYYQREAAAAVVERLQEDRSTLIDMATGLGKSVLLAAIVKHWPGDVLVLAHRNELIEQLRDHLERATGQRVEIEKAESRSSGTARIVVGSVQSFNARRLEGFARDRFSLIVVDEVHHAVATSYRRILDWFMDAKVLGVTATPDRSDGAALGQVIEGVAYRMGIEDGIDAGYLVPLRGKVIDVDEIDISDVGKTGKDLAAGQLDEAMLEAVEPIVRGIAEHGEGRQGLVFCPGVKTAALGAERMNILEPDSARFVSGDTPFDERQLTVQRFREGRVKYLFNCMIFTEGFDAPPASLVGLARPTLSRSLMAQMVGRITRPTTGAINDIAGEEGAEARRLEIEWSSKPDGLILDFVGNSGKHSLASPIDALAGNYTDAEIKVAKKKKGGNLQQNLREARAELRALAAAVEAKARTRATAYDPFSVLKVNRDQIEAFEENYGRSPPTSGQVWAARMRGMTSSDLNGLSKHALSKLLERDKAREAKGWAPYSTMRVLRRFPGMPENVRAEHAQAAIESVQRKWGYPSSIDPAEVCRIAKGE